MTSAHRSSIARLPRSDKHATAVPLAVPRTQPTDNIADIVHQLSTMAISKPTTRSLPADSTLTVKQRSTVSERIQQRRDAVAGKLKRPTQPVKATVPTARRPVKATPPAPASTSSIPSKPSRASPSSPLPRPSRVTSRPAPIKPKPSAPSRKIRRVMSTGPLKTAPLAWDRLRSNARPRTYGHVICRREIQPGVVQSGHIWAFTGITDHLLDAPTWVPRPIRCDACHDGRPHRHVRGEMGYCSARLRSPGEAGNYGYGVVFRGRPCRCHGLAPWNPTYRIHPMDWSVSPAEAPVVDASRPRRVHFNETVSVRSFPKWYLDTFGIPRSSTDPATIENDERQGDDFNSTWQALMDEGFSDDED